MLSKILLPITIPKRILFFLEYEYKEQGYMLLRDFRLHCNRDWSQISQAITRLKEDDLIVREKVGRETKLLITEKGSRHIEKYLLLASEHIDNFEELFLKANIAAKTKNYRIENEKRENGFNLEMVESDIYDTLSILGESNLASEEQINSLAKNLVRVFKNNAKA